MGAFEPVFKAPIMVTVRELVEDRDPLDRFRLSAAKPRTARPKAIDAAQIPPEVASDVPEGFEVLSIEEGENWTERGNAVPYRTITVRKIHAHTQIVAPGILRVEDAARRKPSTCPVIVTNSKGEVFGFENIKAALLSLGLSPSSAYAASHKAADKGSYTLNSRNDSYTVAFNNPQFSRKQFA